MAINTVFCENCRCNCSFHYEKKCINKIIRNKEYKFTITIVVCDNCSHEVYIPGIIDKNTREIDSQYRIIENIITIDEIKQLLEFSNRTAEEMSLALGFENSLLNDYINGKVPTIENSNIIKNALDSYI